MKLHNSISLVVAIIFSLLFIIGITVYADYGISWDEYNQRINGYVNLSIIKQFFNIEILPGVLPENLNGSLDNYLNDLGYEKSSQNFENYIGKQYGAIFDLSMAYLEEKFKIINSVDYFHFRHLSNFLIFYISSIFFYFLLKKRFSTMLSIIGLLFWILSPRIFAESFYNNKDIIFLSFFTIGLYYAIDFLDQPTYKKSFALALSCALAISLRIMGIIIPFIVIIFYILSISNGKRFKYENLSKILVYLILLISFTILIWPHLWTDPLANFLYTFKSMSAYPWRGSVFYFGKYISALNLPWHYPIVWIFISTPILYSILFVVGSIVIISNMTVNFLNLSNSNLSNDIWKNNKERMDLILFLIFFFTIFLVIEIDSTLYGGWRHLYFIYPCFIFIAIRGLELFYNKFSFKYLIFFILPFLINTGFWMVKNHPFQYVFFNSLIVKDINNLFEMDYWGVSNKHTLKHILDYDSNNQIKLYVASNSPYVFSLEMFDKHSKKRIEFVNNLTDADYLVTNHHYQNGHPVSLNYDFKKSYNLINEIKIDNMPVNSVFKIYE